MNNTEVQQFNSVLAELSENCQQFQNDIPDIEWKPKVISLAVTNRCNSRCIMCNIWKRMLRNPEIEKDELTIDEIISLLSQPIFSELAELDVTGGEVHLREDIADMLIAIAELKKTHLPKLRSIIVPSNGLLPDTVIRNYSKVMEHFPDNGLDFVSVNSLDGIGAVHDKIRGYTSAYNRVEKTIQGLMQIREQYHQFIMGIKSTILPYNVRYLDDLLKFAQNRGLFHVISSAYFTSIRFINDEKSSTLSLNNDEKKLVQEFYSRDEIKDGYFYSVCRDLLRSGNKNWRCAALKGYLFIDFDGTVYPCELLPIPLGNIRQSGLSELLVDEEAISLRKKIDLLPQCAHCAEPGAIRFSAYTEGSCYRSYLCAMGVERYRESYDGEGYRKYFREK